MRAGEKKIFGAEKKSAGGRAVGSSMGAAISGGRGGGAVLRIENIGTSSDGVIIW